MLWLAVATASISYTLGPRTPVFDWLREYLGRHVERIDLDPPELDRTRAQERWLTVQLHRLLKCPYCISHWVAFFFTILFHPMPFTGYFIDLIAVPFVIVTIACLLIQAISILGYLASILKHGAEERAWPSTSPITHNVNVDLAAPVSVVPAPEEQSTEGDRA